MEKQQTPLEQTKEILTFIEKAIDVAVSKGCYNKIEVVNLVQGLQYVYQYLDKQPNDNNSVPFKGIKEDQ